jgi:non-heme chloroperoxidase
MSNYERGTMTLTNGDHLSYIKEGSGPVVVLVPGWSQSAAQWQHQIDDLAQDHTVYAVDLRGHGESSDAPGGYRIARLGADLHEFLVDVGLDDITLMGHSMGCSVIWAYLEHYGPERISRLILVDQAPMVTGKPWLSDEDKVTYGCLFPDAAALEGFVSAVNATDTVEGHKEIIRGMFTSNIDEDTLAWIAEQNLQLPRAYAADLLWDHCLQDWRDVIRGIDLPTLVVGSEASIFSADSQRWIAEQNPNSTVEIFEADDGGSHFMFFENPDRFNRHVREFLNT